MKNIALFVVILIFSGCVTQSKRLCGAYGFSKGTRDFSNCVMTETHRSQDSWNRMGDQMRVETRQYQEQMERSYDFNKPSFTCRTKHDYPLGSSFAGSTTICN